MKKSLLILSTLLISSMAAEAQQALWGGAQIVSIVLPRPRPCS